MSRNASVLNLRSVDSASRAACRALISSQSALTESPSVEGAASAPDLALAMEAGDSIPKAYEASAAASDEMFLKILD